MTEPRPKNEWLCPKCGVSMVWHGIAAGRAVCPEKVVKDAAAVGEDAPKESES